MKNHYISQLIIRRFSKAIHVFDSKERRVTRYTHPEKIFYKDDIYTDDVEDILNKELESPFAQLLDRKIINKEKIEITRRDILLLKRFLLLDSVRTFAAEDFLKVMKGFKANSDRYISLVKNIDDNSSMLERLPSFDKINDTPLEFQMRAMKLFIQCQSSSEMIFNPLCTKELYAWAKIFLDGYLTFWDSHEEHEFILTDNGMTAEYEPSHLIFRGLDLSKDSYLCAKIKSTNDVYAKSKYAQLLALNQIMYENFYIFNLSSTRCIILAHPFFRLFDGKGQQIIGSNETVHFDIPDIWPTFFDDKDIVKTPENKYVIPGIHSYDDVFIYVPVKLSEYDTILLNVLLLMGTNKLIGFNDYTKVADSLGVMTLFQTVNSPQIYEESSDLGTLIDVMLDSPYNYIFKHFQKLEYKGKVNPFEWINNHFMHAMSDTRGNKYVLERLLDMESEVRNMSNFEFMGSPDERIELIKSDLANLNKK